jgi:hypothetical protein
MNDNHNQAGDGEAKAKPEVIKTRVGPARAAGYRVPAAGRFNAQAGTKKGPLEVVESSRRVGQGGDQGLQLLRGRGVWVLVSPRVDQIWSGQLRGGATTVREPTLQTSED